jgi:hypothetical protein
MKYNLCGTVRTGIAHLPFDTNFKPSKQNIFDLLTFSCQIQKKRRKNIVLNYLKTTFEKVTWYSAVTTTMAVLSGKEDFDSIVSERSRSQFLMPKNREVFENLNVIVELNFKNSKKHIIISTGNGNS